MELEDSHFTWFPWGNSVMKGCVLWDGFIVKTALDVHYHELFSKQREWAVVHKCRTIEMEPTQVTSERCLAEAFKILNFRGERMPSLQIKSISFLEHNVYLEKTLSNVAFVVPLVLTHRHWSLTYFGLFLCIRFQNIKPVFSIFSLSLFLSLSFSLPQSLLSQLEFLIEKNKWYLILLTRNPLLKLSTEVR